jgi:myotubularin-related protein 6/7/8
MHIVELMDVRGESVLVHCSDGWDRTAQLSTLAQIMLDPHARTFSGFMALLHKEWLSFGHKFEDRLGTLHLPRREGSPVFTQCLDCIWQLMRQHPTAFQFGPTFLIALHYAVNSSEYGTFLCNSEKERLVDQQLHTRTRCLWRAMDHIAPLHTNTEYAPSPDVIIVATTPQSEPTLDFFAALFIPRGQPKEALHNPRKTAAGFRTGGDPEYPEILTVTPSPARPTSSTHDHASPE